jgi:hypothetical protein
MYYGGVRPLRLYALTLKNLAHEHHNSRVQPEKRRAEDDFGIAVLWVGKLRVEFPHCQMQAPAH